MSSDSDDDGARGRARSAQRPQSTEAALALAARHGRNALAEALLAGHALLDAASLALTGRPASEAGDLAQTNDAVRALARLVGGLDGIATRLRADDADGTRRLVDALLQALDAEIARWEDRARSDPDARAVLRAFLGLRELLWELGLRPDAGTGTQAPPAGAPRPRSRRRETAAERPTPKTATAARRRRRVQRVDVDG